MIWKPRLYLHRGYWYCGCNHRGSHARDREMRKAYFKWRRENHLP